MIRPFQVLWFEALGYQYLPPDPQLPGSCVCCGATGLVQVRSGQALCAPCATLAAKKPMASKNVNAGPNGSHVVVASAGALRYCGDLRALGPLRHGTELGPGRNPELQAVEFLLHPPAEPTYFVRLDRAYREIIRNCHPTISARAIHLNGSDPACVDGYAIRAVLTAFGCDIPEWKELSRLQEARRNLGKGPLDAGYRVARELLATWHHRWPDLEPLLAGSKGWLVEPGTPGWDWLKVAARYLRTGDASLGGLVPTATAPSLTPDTGEALA